MKHRVLGVDPGPTTGLCLLEINGSALWSVNVAQCTAGLATRIVDALAYPIAGKHDTLLAVERFVVGRKSMRAGKDGEITRDLIGAIQPVAWCKLQTASEVKPWATDARLDAAGLLDPCKGMRHARDAARHALFAAVKHCGMPDPLSRKAHHASDYSQTDAIDGMDIY